MTLNRRLFTAAAFASLAAPALPAFAQTQEPTGPVTVKGLLDDMPMPDHVMGDLNAPVTILEYASMTCPHCATFHKTTLPKLKEAYVDTGKAKYILRPFPFNGDRRGEAAFMLALCAPNDNYYAMVDALFSTQAAWATAQNPVPELMRLAGLAGMDEAAFKACLSNQDVLTKMIEGRNKAVQDFGVRSTPTVFINDQKLGDSSYETVTEAIEAAL